MRQVVKVTAGAIIERDGKILLQKRAKVSHESGKWGMPGGHVDPGERAEEAVRREIKEETGLDVDVLKFLFYHDEIIPEIDWQSVGLWFKADCSGNLEINEESSEQAWFSREEIEKMDLAFEHNKVLEKYWRMNES